MMKLDADFWEKRYVDNETGWDMGEVSPPLEAYFKQLEDKNIKILIPGGGNSYEAESLYNRGFKNVFVLDFANSALTNIKSRVPAFPDSQLIQGDFFEHEGEYDLIVEQTFFCALNPKYRKPYVSKMKSLLNDGGKLMGLLFNIPLNTDKPPFGGSLEEYKALFTEHFKIKIMEPCYNSIGPRAGNELFVLFEK